MARIVSFGDSWTAGEELTENEVSYGHQLCDRVRIKLEDYGWAGNSTGKITTEILSRADIGKEDFVLICFPPDVRWYGETEDGDFFPLHSIYHNMDTSNIPPFIMQQHEFYMNTMLQYKNWGKYHFNLFIYSIQSYLESIGGNYLMFHNYGKLPTDSKFNPNIDYSAFLSDRSLTTILGGQDENLDSLALHTDGPINPKDIFTGEYFFGKDCHPNHEGHKIIAELIYNNKRFQKWLTLTTNTEN